MLVSRFYRLFGAKLLLLFLLFLNLPWRRNPANERSRRQVVLYGSSSTNSVHGECYMVPHVQILTSAQIWQVLSWNLECRSWRHTNMFFRQQWVRHHCYDQSLASPWTLAIWAIISSPDAVQFKRVWLKRLKNQWSGSKQLFRNIFWRLT